jgi:hypothetical protein
MNNSYSLWISDLQTEEGMLWIFSPEKSGGFGRVQTRDLWYQRPAC